jgi:NAD(P)-dependent dehydrogenase (short-subunit alcohol dehydrogenase family)
MTSDKQKTAQRRAAIVTGSKRGLGFVTARMLAESNYDVVITGRTLDATKNAAAEIQAKVPGSTIEGFALDLTSFPSVRQFVEDFHALGWPLHVLVNNAGMMSFEEEIRHTADGHELTLSTNCIGHFLLTHLLLPDLKAHAPSRIVVMASQMHHPEEAPKIGPPTDFDFDNLRGERSYHPVVAYRNSKLGNLWFSYDLHHRLEGTGVTVNAVCPGFVPETVADHQTTAFKRFLFRYVLKYTKGARSPEKGASNTAFAAIDPSLAEVSGKFFVDHRAIPSSDESYDTVKSRRFWDLNCEWCNVRDSEYGKSSSGS